MLKAELSEGGDFTAARELQTLCVHPPSGLETPAVLNPGWYGCQVHRVGDRICQGLCVPRFA
jgi:hypothetical protein